MPLLLSVMPGEKKVTSASLATLPFNLEKNTILCLCARSKSAFFLPNHLFLLFFKSPSSFPLGLSPLSPPSPSFTKPLFLDGGGGGKKMASTSTSSSSSSSWTRIVIIMDSSSKVKVCLLRPLSWVDGAIGLILGGGGEQGSHLDYVE